MTNEQREALEYLVGMARGHDYAEVAKISAAEDVLLLALDDSDAARMARAWRDGWIVGNRWAFSDADADAIETNPYAALPEPCEDCEQGVVCDEHRSAPPGDPDDLCDCRVLRALQNPLIGPDGFTRLAGTRPFPPAKGDAQ